MVSDSCVVRMMLRQRAAVASGRAAEDTTRDLEVPPPLLPVRERERQNRNFLLQHIARVFVCVCVQLCVIV
jgi:hypothetical protein